MAGDDIHKKQNARTYAMQNFGTWPAAHIKAMMLFLELENHPVRAQHLGNRIMVTYTARARHQWFDMLELNQGFNLGKIGVDLMRNISDEVRDEARQHEITEVRTILFHQKSPLISLFPLFSLPVLFRTNFPSIRTPCHSLHTSTSLVMFCTTSYISLPSFLNRHLQLPFLTIIMPHRVPILSYAIFGFGRNAIPPANHAKCHSSRQTPFRVLKCNSPQLAFLFFPPPTHHPTGHSLPLPQNDAATYTGHESHLSPHNSCAPH